MAHYATRPELMKGGVAVLALVAGGRIDFATEAHGETDVDAILIAPGNHAFVTSSDLLAGS